MTVRSAGWLISVMTVALLLSGGCDNAEEPESACPLGSEGCPCNADGTCDPGLTCAAGSCEAATGTGGAAGGEPGPGGAGGATDTGSGGAGG
jgi:hypothetical protein